jgi:hypothetical protein
MRTTITLDPDIAQRLRALARERDISFKDAVNGVLRLGLSTDATGSRKPYRLGSRRMGLRRGVDLVHALRTAAELEDEETVRKLELRK